MSSPDPSPKAPAKAPRKRRRKLLLGALLLFALGAVLLFAFLPQVVQTLAPPIAARFGYELSIARIERLDLGGVELRGLVLSDTTGASPLELLQASSLQVNFDRRLLRGELDGLNAVRGSGIELRIQLGAGSDEGQDAEPGAGFVWPARLPVVELTDVNVALIPETGEEFLIQLRDARLDAQGALSLNALIDERRLEARGQWSGGVLQELSASVDGLALLTDTELGLTQVGEGKVSLNAQVPVGSESQHIRVQLDGTQIQWLVDIQNLNLADLEARLPVALGVPISGLLTLVSSGEIDTLDPLLGTAMLALEANALRVHDLPLQSLRADLEMRDRELHVTNLDCVQSESNRAHIEQAVLPLEGLTIDNWLPRAEAQISVELSDVPGLLAHFQQVTPDPLETIEHRFALKCELGDSQLTLVECGLQSTAGNVELSRASVDLRQPGHLAVAAHGHADLHDLGAIGSLLAREGWAGALQGELDLQGEWPEVLARLDLSGSDLTLEGVPLGKLSVDMNSSAVGRELELTQLSIESPHGSLLARMHLEYGTQFSMRVTQLELQRGAHGIALQEPVQVDVRAGSGEVPLLVLDGTSGHLELEGEWDPAGFDVRLLCERLDPAGIGELGEPALFAMGPVHIDMRASSRDGVLSFTSTGSATDVTPVALPEPLDLQWELAYANEVLRVTQLHVTGREDLNVEATAELPLGLVGDLQLPDGALSFSLDAHVPLEVVQAGGAGVLSAKGVLTGTWSALVGDFEVAGTGLRLSPELYPADLANTDLRGTLRIGEGIELHDASMRLGEWIQTRLDARITTSTDATRWLEDAAGVLSESEIEGHAQLAKLDIASLRPMLIKLSEAATPLMEGQVVSELTFDGPLLNPRLSGSLSVEDGRLRPGGGLPPVEALTMEVALEGYEVNFQSVRGTLGAAPFEVQGGLDLSGDTPTLDLQLRGKDVLLLRDENARVRADTDLTVRGPLAQLVVQGKIELTTGYYSPDIRFLNLRQGPKASGAQGFQLFALRDAPLRDMSFDIELGASHSFEVRNTVLKGAMRPDLHLGGTGLVPLLTGTVYLDPTRLTLPASTLTLSAGTVRFLKDNPFVPELDILGETRMLGYDIRADITGPYDEPELLLSSTPPLGQEDLFLLVLTGRLPEDPDRNDALSTANTVAIYLARDTLARWFADDGPLNEDTILERLEFTIGEDVSKNGVETFDIGYRLTDRAGKPRETKDARHLYLATQRDKYEDYNVGIRLVFRFKR